MTGLIAIDESGDLGSSGTRYFTMAAIIMLRPRNLKKAADMIPNRGYEVKWNNSDSLTRTKIISALSNLNFKIVYYTVDKNHPEDNRPVYGNELYVRILRQVVRDSLEVLPCRDVILFLDSCTFTSVDMLRKIVREEAEIANKNPVKVNKVPSQQNKCIQLVDFIAGAARANLEYSDRTLEILSEKVSFARRR
jgi:hypothetical protein